MFTDMVLIKQGNALSIGLWADQFEAPTFPARVTYGLSRGGGGEFEPEMSSLSDRIQVFNLYVEVFKGKEFTLPSEWLKRKGLRCLSFKASSMCRKSHLSVLLVSVLHCISANK